MEGAMQLANNPVLWIFSLLIIGVVVFQGITFIRLASRASESVGMSHSEVKTAIKVGTINAIGPSLGIMIVAVSLITLLGDPLTLMRIGIIGSAATESMGATIAASAFGTELGASDFGRHAFVTVVWVLCLGGSGWLLFTVLFTKSLGRMEKKVSDKSRRRGFSVMTIVSTAAMLAVFANFASGEVLKGYNTALAVAISAMTMVIVSFTASRKKHLSWLNEWSLGLSILAALSVSYYTL
ncbi:translation elongation factor EF-1alpha [Mesobacillus campisalis]|uniref:Translation elongation factor EF-1alpha n=1 Tax=Mesobacillus campisalis TaxID=1408103 RepID=A0A0M2SS32_9BACI|nr:DUF5058 family protein [Mesobacillus campisalis]KKK37374.1 translation elongation factor EF-1alpha [Mesobacillus campisalis]